MYSVPFHSYSLNSASVNMSSVMLSCFVICSFACGIWYCTTCVFVVFVSSPRFILVFSPLRSRKSPDKDMFDDSSFMSFTFPVISISIFSPAFITFEFVIVLPDICPEISVLVPCASVIYAFKVEESSSIASSIFSLVCALCTPSSGYCSPSVFLISAFIFTFPFFSIAFWNVSTGVYVMLDE